MENILVIISIMCLVLIGLIGLTSLLIIGFGIIVEVIAIILEVIKSIAKGD